MNRRRKSPIFPSEIIDNIIDHLYNDVPTLRSLALTSRVCLRASRRHLFSCLQLLHQPAWECNMSISTIRDRYRRLDSYLTESPDLAKYVRHLVIHRAEPWHWAWKAVEPILAAILKKLKHVRTISLWKVSWTWLSFAFQISLQDVIAQPLSTSISFHDCHFSNFSSMLSIINQGSTLRHLELKDLYWSNESPEANDYWAEDTKEASDISVPQLYSLHLDCSPCGSLLPLLSKQLTTLQKLKISSLGDYKAAGELINITNETLEVLEIAVSGRHGDNLSVHLICPESIQSLRTLVFHDVRQSQTYSPVSCIVSFLKRATGCRALTEVCINILVEAPPQGSSLDWSGWHDVDNTLAMEDFDHLCNVRISINGDISPLDFQLFEQFPLLTEKKKLSIEVLV